MTEEKEKEMESQEGTMEPARVSTTPRRNISSTSMTSKKQPERQIRGD